MRPSSYPIVACLLAACGFAANAEPLVRANPETPGFGRVVQLEVRNDPYPNYLPATRFVKRGNTIDVAVEYIPDGFGPWRSDFGMDPVTLGELAPGTYDVHATLTEIASDKAPREVRTRFTVAGPTQPGVYTVPAQPNAFAPTQVVLSSAVPIDTARMRVAVGNGLVRIDFTFAAGPAATALTHAVAALPPLAAGEYRIEAWGAAAEGAAPSLFFTRELTVARPLTVVEYYHAGLDHYFLTASGDDIAALDNGLYGGWMRTGQKFKGWATPYEVPDTRPVCRFYAAGMRSHFFTTDTAECETMKALEAQGKAEAQARKQAYLGWQFEGIAFYAYPARDGRCPASMLAVTRFSNGRAAQGDANDRFTVDARQYQAMLPEWIDQGVAFCSPQ